ncbi:MAG: hypothetical protein IPP72_03065 [Chitinophagaceae bacterium]|nr:hypothetical protein [Chitinophagaceae bacterium]
MELFPPLSLFNTSIADDTWFKAEYANQEFSCELKKLVSHPGMSNVYKLVTQQEFTAKPKGQREDVKQVQEVLAKKPIQSFPMHAHCFYQGRLNLPITAALKCITRRR